MATGGRRLHSNRDRSGVGSLDATLAASDAISKAVKTPSMGSAKFATDAGIKTQRVGAMAHTGCVAHVQHTRQTGPQLPTYVIIGLQMVACTWLGGLF
jgi:hypothetical protein